MPLAWDFRHPRDDSWERRGSRAAVSTGESGLLLEDDTDGTQFLLLESDSGAGTDILLLENSN